jgi:hypothetical protein
MAKKRRKRRGAHPDGFHMDQYLSACRKIEELEEAGNAKEAAVWKRVKAQSWEKLTAEQKQTAYALNQKKKS